MLSEKAYYRNILKFKRKCVLEMKIQAAFNAAFGKAIAVYAAVIDNTLVIDKMGDYNTQRKFDTVFLSNNPLMQSDMPFSHDEFPVALQAYKLLTSSRKCVIQQDLAQYRLDNVIDYAGHKDNGAEKFNIAELKNGHWAILAICLYYYRQIHTTQQFDKAMNFLNDLDNLYLDNLRNSDDDFFITI